MRVVLGLIVSFVSLFSETIIHEGEKIYDQKCLSCHQKFISMDKLKSNFLDYNNTRLKLTAPTLNQLSYRLKQRIGDPKGDNDMHRMEVIAFMSDYVWYPDRQKSVCLDDIMQHFNTMPSLEGNISQEELEEVGVYLYDFDNGILKEKSVQYEGFEQTLEKAKKEHKIIMIKVISRHCHYCRKMDREVMIEAEVAQALEKDFILVAMDVSVVELPLGLKTEVTPSFIFVDKNSKVLLNIPGAWDKEDFLEILNEVKAKKDKK